MTTTRRRFLQVSLLAGGGLALGISLPRPARAMGEGSSDGAEVTAFLRIHPDGRIVFVSPNIEMGQGIFTSHSMVIAEELDADLERFEARHSPVAAAYNNPLFGAMGTGGSTSTPAFWMPLRKAGAAARQMLLEAAAERWGVAAGELRTDRGRVIAPDGSTLEYGELAADAARQSALEEPPLKDPPDFRIIGRSTRRLEGPEKVTGEATFGIDLELPGMLTAVVARPPAFGAKSRGVRNETEVLAMPGVRRIKPISSGIAVLADSYWQAKQASDRLDVDWDDGDVELSSEGLLASYEALVASPGAVAEDHGEAEAQLSEGETIEATFHFPFLAHAPMEPLNATAHVRDGEAEVWAGTYLQTLDHFNIAQRLGLAPEKVQLHTVLAGGAFGRRANVASDFVIDAVEAAAGEGVPVKAVWTRENDIQGGMFRPVAVHRVAATLGEDGRPKAWHQRLATQSLMIGTPFEPFLVHDGIDHSSLEGATGMPYAIPHRRIELHTPETAVSGLWWRSVGHTHTGFVAEHFLDLLAHKAGQDPLDYRRKLLADGDPRQLGVLNLAAEKAGWGKRLPEGHAHGLALHKSFNSYVCQIFECSLAPDGTPIAHRVTCAVDVGLAINPWNIDQQVQGSVAYALTAALYGTIDIEAGRVRQSNFHDYPVLRMHEMPPVDVHIVPSAEPPTGIGEPGVPPVAPALANAKLALTGEPTTRLPFVDATWRV
ncbi:MAG: xanthine dehydrogenase family protein molybdopterin-binding subunit [Acidobacteriota bacterium]